jgi:hypothetical protein
MFIPDMPNVPPQNVPVMIAQANQAQAGDKTKARAFGTCFPMPSGGDALSPLVSAKTYFLLYEPQTTFTEPATLTVLQQPKHGILRLMTEADRGIYFSSTSAPIDPNDPGYLYFAEKGYLGDDKASFLIERGGIKVTVVYFLKVFEGSFGASGGDSYCEDTGERWKISSTLAPNGTSTITSIEYQSPTTSATGTTVVDTAALASTLGSSILSNLAGETAGVTVNLADLPGAAVGQTVGSTITLDTNAAGYNWFIDTTPADNSEFLPTSNPNEWVAKAGSAAAGKMDMLSVLLHEYGHALGIDHSANPNDFMGTTLTAGVRRLPTADELALMQNLIAQAKGSLTPTLEEQLAIRLSGQTTPAKSLVISQGERGQNAPAFPTLPLGTSFIGFLGLLRGSRYGGVSIAPDASTLVTQYDWAANATLTNGSLNAADGWSTEGSVVFNPSTGSGRTGLGEATLNEVSGSQTRLSQVFMLNPSDRFLSFTLAGTALDNVTGAPHDAFEVALLDANTGASLLGSDGLTRSDAFLNLQADGTQNAASCVTCINNADGSRTYRVDLAGVPAGVAANLSFDLIGFGQNGSHVTVRDVRLSGLPQLHDDSATLLEDGSLAFNPFAQVDNAAILQLGSHVVDAPAPKKEFAKP